MYRDLSDFFNMANLSRTVPWHPYPRLKPLTSAWDECCTNGRCNSCK